MLRGGFTYSYVNVIYNSNLYYYKNVKNVHYYYKQIKIRLSLNIFWQERFLFLYSYLILTNTLTNLLPKRLKTTQTVVFLNTYI